MKKLLILAALAAGTCLAETTPVMVSLVTPVQAPSADSDVTGLRLDLIYGQAHNVTGLDLGIVNHTRGDFTGLELGGANIIGGRFIGGQLGLLNTINNGAQAWETLSYGAQVGLVNNADSFCGLQDGFLNFSNHSFTGLQSSLLNVANDLRGVQCGYYLIFGVNIVSGDMRGCQIGLVNYAQTMEKGVQIGLVNIISRNGWMPVFPFVNGSF